MQLRTSIIILLISMFGDSHGQLQSVQIAKIADPASIREVLTQISMAEELGLSKNDYSSGLLESLAEGKYPLSTPTDSLHAAIEVNNALSRFLHDVVYGSPPKLSYSGIKTRLCMDVEREITDALDNNNLFDLVTRLEPNTPPYLALKKALDSCKDRLYTSETTQSNSSANQKQRMQLRTRIKALNSALNDIRWMRCVVQESQRTIVVNIPSASLHVFEGGVPVFHSKVIVGKKTNRTPTLTSWMSGITLYPYWHVPKSIATKELLPRIKANVGYLAQNNMQVLNEHGKVINPAVIDWSRLTAENFPYKLRQSTGCDNSLGVVRMNITNPFNVYLHDTPWKGLFSSKHRFFSHGCIRVEKAIDLALLLLKDNKFSLDIDQLNACLKNQQPTDIRLDSAVPVLVLYNTAWFDENMEIQFYFDVYSRNTAR